MPRNDDANTNVQSHWTHSKTGDSYLSVELRVMPTDPDEKVDILVDLLRRAKDQKRPCKLTMEVPVNAGELDALNEQKMRPEPAYHSAVNSVVGPILYETYAEVLEAIAENLTTDRAEYEAIELEAMPLATQHKFCDLAAREFIVEDDERPDIAAVCLPVDREALIQDLKRGGLKVADLMVHYRD